MQAIGFRHFAQQSPNHLALAAPDGRHWSRGELLAECDRLARIQSNGSRCGSGFNGTALPNSAGLIAMALTLEFEPFGEADFDSPQTIANARACMQPLGILPDDDNVHYCASPGRDCDSLGWALAALHYGHPVVLADDWNAPQLVCDIERYRVTSLYLSSECASDLMHLARDLDHRYDTSSIRHLIINGTSSIPSDYQPLYTWFKLPTVKQAEC